MVVTIDFWVTVAIVVIRVTNVPKVSRLSMLPSYQCQLFAMDMQTG
jgi:hypothetical protein